MTNRLGRRLRCGYNAIIIYVYYNIYGTYYDPAVEDRNAARVLCTIIII